jgi:sulfate adenylyltransferase subunit 1
MEALKVVRVATAGSVDDGKSTLIGRLLHDSRALYTDQLEHVEEASRRRGFARTELALLTDGLRAEREQGITIDVAWRYFTTARARFVLADTPGHVQYTRNMVTGASHADVAVVLIDAERGPTEQSRRHLAISALLAVPRLLVAVNKMDRVGHAQARYQELVAEIERFLAALPGQPRATFVPVAALAGDNVVERSTHMPWYDGPTLITLLEEASSRDRSARGPGRFAVQWVIRPQEEQHHDYRGLAGRMTSGTLRTGDQVVILPAGLTTRLERIELGGDDRESAVAGDSVTLHLADDLDVARGDLVAGAEGAPAPVSELDADVCWLSSRPLAPGARVTIKHTSRRVRAVITTIEHVVDMTHATHHPAAKLQQNDIGRVHIRLAEPLCPAPYAQDRALGSLLIIDDASAETIGAGMVRALPEG